jgi:hypothetical protein
MSEQGLLTSTLQSNFFLFSASHVKVYAALKPRFQFQFGWLWTDTTPELVSNTSVLYPENVVSKVNVISSDKQPQRRTEEGCYESVRTDGTR